MAFAIAVVADISGALSVSFKLCHELTETNLAVSAENEVEQSLDHCHHRFGF